MLVYNLNVQLHLLDDCAILFSLFLFSLSPFFMPYFSGVELDVFKYCELDLYLKLNTMNLQERLLVLIINHIVLIL